MGGGRHRRRESRDRDRARGDPDRVHALSRARGPSPRPGRIAGATPLGSRDARLDHRDRGRQDRDAHPREDRRRSDDHRRRPAPRAAVMRVPRRASCCAPRCWRRSRSRSIPSSRPSCVSRNAVACPRASSIAASSSATTRSTPPPGISATCGATAQRWGSSPRARPRASSTVATPTPTRGRAPRGPTRSWATRGCA